MKINRLKLSTRIALTYSFILLLASLSILFITNILIKKNLNTQPIIKAISPNVISITINRDVGNSLSYYIPIESDEFIKELAQANINADTFNNMLNNSIMKRVLRLSILTSIVISLLSIIVAVHYSKRITAPISQILKVTNSISINNMKERINTPSKYDETSQIIMLFNKALDRLQSTFQDLELFNSYASHELRNSLAILRACLEQGLDDKEDHTNILIQSKDYIQKLSNTVDDIMALTSRQLTDCKESVDLALITAQAVDEYTLAGANLELILPDEGVLPVAGKEVWLYRVICNLLDNALKHSCNNSPVIVKIEQKFNAVILSVMDQGKGISEQILETIWQPYYSKPSPGKKGIGLGLAMVRQVVDTLGGFTWVESCEGMGSSFYISLPVIHAPI